MIIYGFIKKNLDAKEKLIIFNINKFKNYINE